MSKLQHRPGISTVNVKHPQLRGANVMAALIGRFGANRKDEPFICVDEDAFWREYLPSITVDGLEIKLNSKTLPLPKVVARILAARPGSKIRRYQELKTWLLAGASDKDVLLLAQRLTN